jgi:hypothetical protein
VTQQSDRPNPAPNEPANSASQSPAVEDLDATKGVSDADANRVKGGVKKTMSTQV